MSTTVQKLEAQIAQLRNADCQRIYQEKHTGYDRKRTQLKIMPRDISDADTLIVTSLDRLTHSTHNLFEITRTLENQGVNFKSLREPWVDTTRPMGKFLLTGFAGHSELERNLIKDRTEERRQVARKRGVRFGGKPKLIRHQQSEAAKMIRDGQSIRAIACHFSVEVATIDRIKNASRVQL